MAIVVTILCQGTANSTDRSTSGGSELVISKIQTLLAGTDEWDWILCEGAGTKKLRQQSTVTGINPFVGRFEQGWQHPGTGPGPAPALAGMPTTRTPRIVSGSLMGVAAGQGVEGNVARALDFIAKRGPLNLTVNLAGHSRGSMTCYKIAYALFEKYGAGIPVNIFAIDPVPGNNGTINKEMYSHIALGPNVRNSFLMLAESEHRLNFRPYIDAIYSTGGNEGNQFDTMPGTHGGINELTGSESEAAALVLSRALRFLKANRTSLTDEVNRYILDENGDHTFGALRMYSKLMMRLKEYKAHASVNPLGKSPAHGFKADAKDRLNRVGNLAMTSFNVDKHRIANVAGPKDTWDKEGHQTADPDTRGRADHHGLKLDAALQQMKVDPHAQRPNRFFANKEHEDLFRRLYPTFCKGVLDLEKAGTPEHAMALHREIADATETYNKMCPDTQAYFYAFCQDRRVLP